MGDRPGLTRASCRPARESAIHRRGGCGLRIGIGSFNATVIERVYRTVYPTRKKARGGYCTSRSATIGSVFTRHSALGYRTPQEAHDEYLNRPLAARNWTNSAV